VLYTCLRVERGGGISLISATRGPARPSQRVDYASVASGASSGAECSVRRFRKSHTAAGKAVNRGWPRGRDDRDPSAESSGGCLREDDGREGALTRGTRQEQRRRSERPSALI